jgi:hypothetical protein
MGGTVPHVQVRSPVEGDRGRTCGRKTTVQDEVMKSRTAMIPCGRRSTDQVTRRDSYVCVLFHSERTTKSLAFKILTAEVDSSITNVTAICQVDGVAPIEKILTFTISARDEVETVGRCLSGRVDEVAHSARRMINPSPRCNPSFR